eukprot:1145163-Ditylum_brightwellii.AAC.1
MTKRKITSYQAKRERIDSAKDHKDSQSESQIAKYYSTQECPPGQNNNPEFHSGLFQDAP